MTLRKFGRNYELTIQVNEQGETLVIEPPFTLELDVVRNTSASSNSCKLRIYNLDMDSRNLINFNSFNKTEYRSIQLKAGYGDNLPVIFAGNVGAAHSVREGVNFITQIECYAGGYAYVNGDINISFPKGTPNTTVIATLMGFLPNIDVAAIGNFEGELPRGITMTGSPRDKLFEFTGGAFNCDNGKAFALKNNEYASSIPTALIDESTGLLNTPVLEQSIVRFEMIFEPTLNVNGLVKLASSTFPALNGFYTVTAVKHHGIISEVVSGDLITQGEFFYSNELVSIANYLSSTNNIVSGGV